MMEIGEEQILAAAKEVRRQVFEKHQRFVEEYRRGDLPLKVDLVEAGRFRYFWTSKKTVENILQALFLWLCYLCVPAAIALFIWSSWWIGAVVLVVAFVSWQANRLWMKRLMIQWALEDPWFFGRAVERKAIILPSTFELWGDPFRSIQEEQSD